jgi:hypothetical protein
MNSGVILHDDWSEVGKRNGWVMPAAPRWKRLPVVRHLRALRAAWYVYENEAFWGRLGMIPNGYDRWVLHGIWKGRERAPQEPQP